MFHRFTIPIHHHGYQWFGRRFPYPLVNIQKAIENGHLVRWSSHWKWWCSIVMLVYQGKWSILMAFFSDDCGSVIFQPPCLGGTQPSHGPAPGFAVSFWSLNPFIGESAICAIVKSSKMVINPLYIYIYYTYKIGRDRERERYIYNMYVFTSLSIQLHLFPCNRSRPTSISTNQVFSYRPAPWTLDFKKIMVGSSTYPIQMLVQDPSLTELDDGKIYRKPLYLMLKTMVSCRFSLKPIHWLSLKNGYNH